MADSTGGSSLNAAYEAIKAKDLAKARDVLSAYLVDHPNDVDAWWLYSYAVTDVEQGRKALETVLRLDPSYPGARDLLTELEAASPSPAGAAAAQEPSGLKPLARPSDAAPMTADIDPDDSEAEFGFADETKPDGGRFRRLLISALAAAIVIVIVAVVFILPNLNRPPAVDSTLSPTTTSVAFGATDVPTQDTSGAAATDVPTDAPTLESDVTTESPTGESPTSEAPTSDVPSSTDTVPAATDAPPAPTSESGGVDTNQAVYDSLGSFNVVPESATTETTQLGQTVAVSICAASSELRSVIPAALTAITGASSQVPEGTQAIGAKFVNCSGDGAVLRYVALDIADAQSYAAGTLTDSELRSRFVPLP